MKITVKPEAPAVDGALLSISRLKHGLKNADLVLIATRLQLTSCLMHT